MSQLGATPIRWRILGGILGVVQAFTLLDAVHTHIGNLGEGRAVAWTQTLLLCELFWLIYAAFIPPVLLLANRFRLDVRSVRNVLVHVVAALAFAYLHILATVVLLSPFQFASTLSIVQRVSRLIRLNFALDFLTYWVVVGATYALHFHAESRRREMAAAELHASLSQARLQALQAQLNPHFLFNTLNAISVLALAGKPQTVVDTLARLGALLRIVTDDSRPAQIPLAQELEFVDRYLDIQHLRFGARLTIDRQVDEGTLDASVPSMILQPLVENAIQHGISETCGACRIGIEAMRLDDALVLRVTDNGKGFATVASARRGVGLGNVRARLEQLYGPAHRLELGKSADGGASVTMALPFSLAARASAAMARAGETAPVTSATLEMAGSPATLRRS